MQKPQLNALCEIGQEQLMRMEYLQAEQTLIAAEEIALREQNFDVLSRLYMPLQESRRQRRQRCGEGTIRLNLIANDPNDILSPEKIVAQCPQGQLLVAGWGSIQPALKIRQLATEKNLYLETFLAAAYPMHAGKVIVLFSLPDVTLPPPEPMPIDLLLRRLPPHRLVLTQDQIPQPIYSNVMNLWEQLHAPFLAAADLERDPLRKINAYRNTIRVDYACELAHQNLAEVARHLFAAPR
jgi:hypothetical protein